MAGRKGPEIRFRGDTSEIKAATKEMVDNFKSIVAAATKANQAITQNAMQSAQQQHAAIKKTQDQELNDLLKLCDKEVAAREKADRKASDVAAKEAQRRVTETEKAAAQILRDEQRLATDRMREAAREAAFREKVDREKMRLTQEEMRAEEKKGSMLGGLKNTILDVGKSYLTWGAAVAIIHQIASAIKEAEQYQEQMANQFIAQRDAMREIAVMQGKPANTQTTLDELKFGSETGLKAGEIPGFKTGFQSSAAQYKDRMGDEQYNQYAKNIGRMSAQTGIDANTVGAAGGRVLGFNDWTGKYGAKGADKATAAYYRMLKTLMEGEGGNAVLAGQMMQSTGTYLSDNDLLSTFKGEDRGEQVSAWVSSMAKIDPGEGATLLKEMVKGTRFGKDDKQDAALKKWGVKEGMSPEEAVKKIATGASGEAKKTGLDMNTILGRYYNDRELKGMMAGVGAVLPNAAGETLMGHKRAYQATIGDDAFQGDFDKAAADPNDALSTRITQGRGAYYQAQTGQRTANFETMYKETEDRLRSTGSDQTGSANMAKMWRSSWGGTLGFTPSARERDVYRAMLTDMGQRGRGKGLKMEEIPGYKELSKEVYKSDREVQYNDWTSKEWFKNSFSNLTQEAGKKGVNLMAGADEALYTPADQHEAAAHQITLLGSIDTSLKQIAQGGPNAPKAAPRPLPQPPRAAPGLPARLN